MAKLIPRDQAARELGIPDTMLRAWEEKGVIKPVTLPNGEQGFTREEVDRMKCEMGELIEEGPPSDIPS